MKQWLHYLWWIPIVFFYYIGYGWVSRKSSIDETAWYSSKWFWFLILMGACPWWAIVSRITNNIIFDAFLYDMLMLIGFYMVMIIMGAGEKFCSTQWIGVGLTFVGFILMRCNFKGI
ncbi:MAG: hypothetical protein JSW62_02950 [Thermoplasmatales archaeon]|nr:MAG: hypothetical protein JSW62_02950 [Thermoplasmatales archaeon]